MVNLVSAGLLLFWGIYFGMAGTGNVANWLSERGYHGRLFRFSSKNFELIDRVAKRHGTGESSVKVFFVIVMSWEVLSAAAYLSALALYLVGEFYMVQYAFFVGMGLFAGLILGNEAFVYYDDEEEHVVMFLAQLVSYVAVVLL
ncbi:MAG TPA: hypothetical protein VFE91_07130 [Nitrososphaerales archaeon]|nr:hypothetical protein [Nitrososphaerales archaeon]